MMRAQRYIAILTLMCGITGCAGSTANHADAWFGRDKALHFGYSAAIGTVGSAVMQTQSDRPKSTGFAVGMACALAVGAAKEWYDQHMKGTYWSWKDFCWDAAGGSAGSLLGIHIP